MTDIASKPKFLCSLSGASLACWPTCRSSWWTVLGQRVPIRQRSVYTDCRRGVPGCAARYVQDNTPSSCFSVVCSQQHQTQRRVRGKSNPPGGEPPLHDVTCSQRLSLLASPGPELLSALLLFPLHLEHLVRGITKTLLLNKYAL